MNVMTLGGLALAVGILVDDATVAIENTYRVLEAGTRFRDAVVEGAATIAKPTLISTLSICSAFVSVLFLTGAPKYIFTPQALAVVFAMLASYVLSRTLVPILIDVLVGPEHEAPAEAKDAEGRRPQARPVRPLHGGFERGFERFQRGYIGLLHAVLARRLITGGVAGGVMLLCAAACSRSWAGTTSRRSTAGRSRCTCAPAPAPASRRPPSCSSGRGHHPPGGRARPRADHRRQYRPAVDQL